MAYLLQADAIRVVFNVQVSFWTSADTTSVIRVS